MNNREKPVDLWNSIWKDSKETRDEDTLPRLIYEVIKKSGNIKKGNSVLEAGSGSGAISLRLAKNEGCTLSLLDISEEAINISKRSFDEENIKAGFHQASIFEMPFCDEVFDVVWNAGVLEHFSQKEQEEAMSEMFRVCRRGGIVVTLNPYARAFLYRLGKKYEEKTGKWRWGKEDPIRTLAPVCKKVGARIEKEYSVGFFEQMRFLYSMPLVGSKIFRLGEIVKDRFWKANYLPGYLLVTVIKK